MKPGIIRPKAVCIFRRGSDILVSGGRDEVKGETYYCAPGGGIEFGERSDQAARREMREELGAEVDDLALLAVLENVFTLEGQQGHEILFVFTARFRDPAPYERNDEVHGDEEGTPLLFVWRPLEDFAPGGPPLYPTGLYELLQGMPAA